ncbi:MAG: DUF6491 family protein [Caulobacter sp.]|nr:DUF6491 family protein [Caulobacter sp.]
MMKRIAITAAVAGLGLAAANASAVAGPEADAKPPRTCFFASQLNGWRSEGDRVVYLEVGARDIYRAELFSRCHDLDSALTLGVRSRAGGTSICDGLDVELVVPGSIGPQVCHVSKLQKLTPDEVAALKARRKK